MKKLPLGTSTLVGAGLVATATINPAAAADPIKLSVGGFFKTAYMAVIDDDDEGDLGNEHSTDGFFSDAEIYFSGSTVLDNGLEVGARIELEGENDDDQIDEAWIFFSGGFGEVHIGSEDDALSNNCIVPPGGTANFSAYSPNQWGANTLTSNTVCAGLDGDAQKILYVTPSFAGFQVALSYTPSAGSEDHNNDGGPHAGMPENDDEEARHNVSIYATYAYEADGWGLTWGGGASFEGHVEQTPGPDAEESEIYQTALNLSLGNFGIGGVFQYLNDIDDQGPNDVNAWVAGIGAAYTYDAWTWGMQYSYQDRGNDGTSTADEFQQDRVVLTTNYDMGPGVAIDAELGYTWTDTDPENGTFTGVDVDDYNGLEIGIGTNFTF